MAAARNAEQVKVEQAIPIEETDVLTAIAALRKLMWYLEMTMGAARGAPSGVAKPEPAAKKRLLVVLGLQDSTKWGPCPTVTRH